MVRAGLWVMSQGQRLLDTEFSSTWSLNLSSFLMRQEDMKVVTTQRLWEDRTFPLWCLPVLCFLLPPVPTFQQLLRPPEGKLDFLDPDVFQPCVADHLEDGGAGPPLQHHAKLGHSIQDGLQHSSCGTHTAGLVEAEAEQSTSVFSLSSPGLF